MVKANRKIAPESLWQYRNEAKEELAAILAWWENNMVDEANGGFYGSVNNNNVPDTAAAKGIVLNSRICWTFSAAYAKTKNENHLRLAIRAFDYIQEKFIDTEFGGVVWSVETSGQLQNGRKQAYGQAFCIYAMAEFYNATGNEAALFFAKKLYSYLEQYCFDAVQGGYIEARARDWTEIADVRLSEKDDNARKTMNTHLHIIEACANLYKVWPDKGLKGKIGHLLQIFDTYIIDKENHHLRLFMNDDWEPQSLLISYGHDIEAAWLLQECAETAGYTLYVDRYRQLAIDMADAAAKGLDADGGLWYEFEPGTAMLVREKHSWPQAEAMVGFYNAFQLTGDEKYYKLSYNSWHFIRQHICDTRKGEWFWGISETGVPMEKEKAGFWKCPYHNSRACMEIIKRIDDTVNKNA